MFIDESVRMRRSGARVGTELVKICGRAFMTGGAVVGPFRGLCMGGAGSGPVGGGAHGLCMRPTRRDL